MPGDRIKPEPLTVGCAAVRLALELGATQGASAATLTRGTGVRPSICRSPFRRVSWEAYAELMERLEAAVGGEEALLELSRNTYQLMPEFNILSNTFRSPKRAMQFMFDTVQPTMWPMLSVEITESRSRGVELNARLKRGYRPCRPFFAWTAGAAQGIPAHLGFAPANVRDLQLTGRSAHLQLRFPTGGGSGAKVRSMDRVAVEVTRLQEVDRRVGKAVVEWKLSPRQVEVLRHLVAGRDNQEIARELGCSVKTVEAHVTSLLNRADAPSRLAVVAAFWSALA